jgi:hypothetical protein
VEPFEWLAAQVGDYKQFKCAPPLWVESAVNLVRKTFIFDVQANQAGAFYLGLDRASAEAAHDEVWRNRIRSAYGSEPRVRYFDTPLVITTRWGPLSDSPDALLGHPAFFRTRSLAEAPASPSVARCAS